MSDVHISIVTPKEKVYEDNIHQITLFTSLGQITILPHHMDLCATVMPGLLLIKKEKEEITLISSDGFVTVSNNQVTLLCENVQFLSDIKKEDIHEALEKTKSLLEKYTKNDTIKKRIQKQLAFEKTRLQVQEMYEKE